MHGFLNKWDFLYLIHKKIDPNSTSVEDFLKKKKEEKNSLFTVWDGSQFSPKSADSLKNNTHTHMCAHARILWQKTTLIPEEFLYYMN